MAQLTWQNVDVPNFNGVGDSQQRAGLFLKNSFDTLTEAVKNFSASGDRKAIGVNAAELMRFNNIADLDAAVASGAIDPRAAQDPAFREFIASQRQRLANVDQTGVQTEGMRLNNQNQSLVNSQKAWDDARVRGYEANRPEAVQLQANIRTELAKGTPEGRENALRLEREGAGKFANAGVSIEGMGTINDRNTSAAGDNIVLNGNLRQEQTNVENFDRAKRVDAEINRSLKAFATPEQAIEAVRINPDLDAKTKAATIEGIGGITGLFQPQIGLEDALVNRQINRAAGGTQQPAGSSLIDLVDRKEGGGRYDTLFAHSQRQGGAFAGTDVSKMTLDQLSDFDRSYGPWVKGELARQGQDPRIATPMGRFQIVGDTRRAVAREMGLPGNTVFTADVQNAMFNHLVDKRISGPRTMQGKMTSLRQEWEGFKSVPDNVLAQAISAYEKGDKTSLGNLQGGNSPSGSSSAASILGTQNQVNQSFLASYSGSNQGVDQADQDLLNATNLQVNRAASVVDSINVDGALDPTASITDAFVNGPDKAKSSAELAAEIHKNIGDADGLPLDQITDEINYMRDKYHIRPDIAAAFIKNATAETTWGINYFLGDRNVNRGLMDQYIGEYMDSSGNLRTGSPKIQGILGKMEEIRSKRSMSEKLQNIITQVQSSQQAYATILSSGKTAGLEKARLTYQTHLSRLKTAIDQTEDNPLTRVNSGSIRIGQAAAQGVIPEQGRVSNIGSGNRGAQGVVEETPIQLSRGRVSEPNRVGPVGRILNSAVQSMGPKNQEQMILMANRDIAAGEPPAKIAQMLTAAGVPRAQWPTNLVQALRSR